MEEYTELVLAESHTADREDDPGGVWMASGKQAFGSFRRGESELTPCGRCGCPLRHLSAHNEFHQQVDSLVRQFERQENTAR